MERIKMEVPSDMLAYLQQRFFEVSEADIAAAEPEKEFPEQSNSVRRIGVATEEMRKWWVLAEAKSHPLYDPADFFSRSKEEREKISAECNTNRMNYDVFSAIFSNLASRAFGGVVAGGCLTMYKGWIIGTLMPQSRLASAGHSCHVTKC